jgi:beta-lactamase superfamily II metal-dependent hydrolase
MLRRLGVTLVSIATVVVMFPSAAGAGSLPPGGTFGDDNGNIHEGNIEAIAAAGITRGCNPPTNDRYCPSDAVTRGQMAAFIRRALTLPDSPIDYFVDDGGSVFEGDINAVAAAGITKGCNPPTNDQYCPDGQVTRGQMAAFLRRAFDYPSSPTDFFTDDNASVFEADINAIAAVGVTKGCNPPTNDQYCPTGSVRRDQMASFFARALGLAPITPPPPEPGGGELSVVFVAVRQGDAAIYRGACGEVGVIDVNQYRVNDVLAALDMYANRTLKWIAVSHYDADHLGDVEDLARSPGVTVASFYDRGGSRTVKDTQTYRDYYDYVTGQGTRQPVDIGETFTLCSGPDTVTFTVISQGTDGTAIGGIGVSDENDRGLCVHVEYYDFDVATCGDIDGTDTGSRTDVESPSATAIGDVEVAKVNHHGSSYSSNQTWVNTLNAEVAVLSVGNNSYGHPSATVLTRWATSGAVLYQTNSTSVSTGLVDGNVILTTTGTTTFDVTTTASGRNDSYPVTP